MPPVRFVAWLVLVTGWAATSQPQSTSSEPAAFRQAQLAIEDGRFVDAENLARLVVEFRSDGTRQAEVPGERERAADLLVEALIANGRGAEMATRAMAEDLVRLREPGSNVALLANAARRLGDVLAQSGESAAALAQFDRARRLRESSPTRDDLALAEDLEHLASAETQSDRYDEALQSVNRAMDLRLASVSPDDPSLARASEIRGLIWQRRGDYPRARADLDRALAVRERHQPSHPSLARTLAQVGLQQLLERDLPGARSTLERAVGLAQSTLRPEHPDIAADLRLLAIPIQEVGDLVQARSLLERAVSIAETSLGRDNPSTADCVHDLAGTVATQGDYAMARSLYERALRSYEQRLGAGYRGVATALHNLAMLNARLGDYERAQSLHQRAVASWERTMGPRHPFVASALMEFGQTLVEQDRDREARPLFERALGIREAALGADNPSVAEVLSALANTLARTGQPRRAVELSERALNIWNQSQSPDVAGHAQSLLVHAAILQARGEIDQAVGAIDQALALKVSMLGQSHPQIAQARAARASLLALSGQREEALAEAMRAEQTGREHLRLMLRSLPERQALDYAAARPRGLDLALSLAVDGQAGSIVFDSLIRGRALVLDEEAARVRAIANEPPELASLRAKLTSARQRLANLMIRGPSGEPAEQYGRMLSAANQDKEEGERALADKSASFRGELSRASIGLDQVRRQLPSGSALVSFVRFNRSEFAVAPSSPERRHNLVQGSKTVPSYVAFVLRPDAGEPAVVQLGPAAPLEALIATWREQMRPSASPTQVEADPSFYQIGVSLRRKVWEPVRVHLEGVRRVFVVPDGVLGVVPLAGLPTTKRHYLLEDGPVIHYLSAERDLAPAGSGVAAMGKGLLSVGGPWFNDASSFGAAASNVPARPTNARTALRGPSPGCATFRSMRFEMLPATRTEAQAVAGLWDRYSELEPRTPSSLLLGAAATERAVKERGPGTRILHVATHGFFLGDGCTAPADGTRSVGGLVSVSAARTGRGVGRRKAPLDNPLLYSGLALAGANRRGLAALNEEDGILTAEEVAALNLDGVEWAVLSACDTGLGTVAAGEGVLGLRRAFQVAGARTVIMSLWSVEDQATRQWMEALYHARLRRHLDTADAVREAGLTVLRERRAKGQSVHPFYWASFVAAGEWR